jgi:hypothetical protein
MEQLYFISECCGGPVVGGCESMTLEQAETWLSVNGEPIENTECGDTQKYILMPVDNTNEPVQSND